MKLYFQLQLCFHLDYIVHVVSYDQCIFVHKVCAKLFSVFLIKIIRCVKLYRYSVIPFAIISITYIFLKFVLQWSKKSIASVNRFCARDIVCMWQYCFAQYCFACCKALFNFVQLCTTLYSFVQLYTTLYNSVQFLVSMHFTVALLTQHHQV